MEKITQRELRAMVQRGDVTDISGEGDWNALGESCRVLKCGHGVYGLNCALLKGERTGMLYAITRRSQALFIFV